MINLFKLSLINGHYNKCLAVFMFVPYFTKNTLYNTFDTNKTTLRILILDLCLLSVRFNANVHAPLRKNNNNVIYFVIL